MRLSERRTTKSERCLNVRAPPVCRELDLRASVMLPHKHIAYRTTEVPSYLQGLIEAAVILPPPVKRDWDNAVRIFEQLDAARLHKSCNWPRE
jgi:hypothetical protein